ncbi:MAG TPA: ion transporter [Saprospiraceae bacterium]|nr:ion transporter [Saprospiraceae bacterium]
MQFGEGPFLRKTHEIIFEADTRAGKLFDVVLLILILLSVVIVMIESVPYYHENYWDVLLALEWIFTIIFSIEYVLRIISSKRPIGYMLSFYGIIDLLSILPAYLSFFFAGTHYLLTIRALRLMRIFRIFKLVHFIRESDNLFLALVRSRMKIIVFLIFIMIVVVFLGSVMYLIEGTQDSGFTSIPRSVYWAIVTLTTVGYGDIAPVSPIGQTVAAIIMILGYSVIAVPTGIIGAELIQGSRKMDNISTQVCPYCSAEGIPRGANYCHNCGKVFED